MMRASQTFLGGRASHQKCETRIQWVVIESHCSASHTLHETCMDRIHNAICRCGHTWDHHAIRRITANILYQVDHKVWNNIKMSFYSNENSPQPIPISESFRKLVDPPRMVVPWQHIMNVVTRRTAASGNEMVPEKRR